MRGGGIDRILFEAPRKDQQAWLIRRSVRSQPRQHRLQRGPRARDTSAGATSRTPATSRAHGSSPQGQPAGALGRNVAGAYRGVAVTSFDGELDEGSLARYFVGREAYRRTRSSSYATATRRRSSRPEGVRGTAVLTDHGAAALVGPAECAYVEDPEVDTAVPTAPRSRRAESGTAQTRSGGTGPLRSTSTSSSTRATTRDCSRGSASVSASSCSTRRSGSRVLPRPFLRWNLVPDVVEFDQLAQRQQGHQLPAALSGRWRLHRGRPCGIWTNARPVRRGYCSAASDPSRSTRLLRRASAPGGHLSTEAARRGRRHPGQVLFARDPQRGRVPTEPSSCPGERR